MTNRNPAAGLVGASGAPLIQDIKATQVKCVVVPLTYLVRFLQMDTKSTFRVTGWPEGGELVGLGQPVAHPELGVAITLIVHHPSFLPVTPGQRPPFLHIELEQFDIVLPPNEDVFDQV